MTNVPFPLYIYVCVCVFVYLENVLSLFLFLNIYIFVRTFFLLRDNTNWPTNVHGHSASSPRCRRGCLVLENRRVSLTTRSFARVHSFSAITDLYDSLRKSWCIRDVRLQNARVLVYTRTFYTPRLSIYVALQIRTILPRLPALFVP